MKSTTFRVTLVDDIEEATAYESKLNAMQLADILDCMADFGLLTGLDIPENPEVTSRFRKRKSDGRHVINLETFGGRELGFVQIDPAGGAS